MTPTRLVAPALMLLAAAAAGCSAHLHRVDEPTLDFEPLWMGVPIARNHLFEAQLPHHVDLYNGLDEPRAMEDGGFSTTLSFSFIVHARVMSTQAAPVLPPSYLPRLRLQLNEILPVDWGSGAHAQRLAGFLGLTAGHHANGQNGCALQGGTKTGTAASDFDCVWPTGVTPSADLNLENGAFTANYAAADLFVRWLAFPGDGGVVQRSLSGKVGVDWMVPCGFAGCMDPGLRARFGQVMFRWAAVGEWVVLDHPHRAFPLSQHRAADARLRASLYGAFNQGVEAGYDPFWYAAAEVAWLTHFDGGGMGGPFVRYWQGRDDLNIRFEERHAAVTVGILVELSAPLRLAGPTATRIE
jgi:hypothetical protein